MPALCAATIAATSVADLGAPSGDPGDARGGAAGKPPGQVGGKPDPEPEYRTVVDTTPTDDPLEAQRDLERDTPGFGTSVDLHDEQGATPDDALAEVVARTPGASVRSVGGLGQFASVALRGGTSQQVGLFTDGVPLGDSFGGLVNLADLPLSGLSRIDIYRGYVPARFGGSTLGGAINLVSTPRWGVTRSHAHVGFGSFGGRQMGTSLSVPLRPRLHLTTRVSYAGSQGDFAFYDNAGTPTFTADDATTLRRNNDYDRVLGQVRVDGERGPVRFHVQQWYVGRFAGVAGPVGAPALATRLRTHGLRTTAGVEHTAFGRPGGKLQGLLGVGVRRQRFVDPDTELGPGANDQTLRAIDIYASPRWRAPLWRGAFFVLSSEVRPEWIDVQEDVDLGAVSGDATRSRVRAGVGAELEQFLFDRRLRLVPAMRVDALHSRLDAAETAQDDRTAQVGLSPRAGARLRVAGPLQMRASAGRYFRAPTLLELFGDRGYAVGNDALQPERGTHVDGGFVLDHATHRGQLHGQLAGFATWSENLISWVAAGRISRAVNLAAAHVRGLEASMHAATADRRLVAEANYTFTDAIDRGPNPTFRGQPLVGRPRHSAFVRASVGRRFRWGHTALEPRLFASAEYLAGTRLDSAGRFEVPPRVLQNMGTQLRVAERLRWSLEVRNLLDVRTGAVTLPVGDRRPTPVAISDFLGFPLPGRSVWTTLTLDILPLSGPS